MRRVLLAAVCFMPLAALAQTTDRGATTTAPAPVPAVPPPSAQTGGGTAPPEQIAPSDKGTVGGLQDHSGKSAPAGGATQQ